MILWLGISTHNINMMIYLNVDCENGFPQTLTALLGRPSSLSPAWWKYICWITANHLYRTTAQDLYAYYYVGEKLKNECSRKTVFFFNFIFNGRTSSFINHYLFPYNMLMRKIGQCPVHTDIDFFRNSSGTAHV